MKVETENNWYVITGTLSSGKTTVINKLKERGYRVVPELAREYIDEELAKGKSIEEIRSNELEFQQHILQMKIDVEKTLPRDEIVFLDRGIPDSVAYYRLNDSNDDSFLKKAVKEAKYAKVFLLDMVEYAKDYARVESDEERYKIQQLLKVAYTENNFNVVRVPVMKTKDARVDFILRYIGK